MALSKEEESYKNFTSLREKFSKQASTPKQDTQKQDKPRKFTVRPKRTSYDPRSNAPPLMPLVEEGDQIQQELFSVEERLQKLARSKTVSAATPVKGKWKHSSHYRANHLNGPDFDALETASVTSCSSAYSSRSESSTFSPFGPGSITELSDIGSCDTFLEYDHHPHRSTTEGKTINLPEDIPPERVQKSTRAWNRAIGEWVFQEVQQQQSPKPRIRRPSNEVRIPTPLSTPLSSTSNLLDCGSSTSLLSCSGSYNDLTEEDAPGGNPTTYKLGRFLRSESNIFSSGEDEEPSATPTDKDADTNTSDSPTTAPPTNKWQEALAKFNRFNRPPQSRGRQLPSETSEADVKERECSIVEKHAEKFGGAKSLRRTQSFRFGTRPPSQLTTHRLSTSSFNY